jgi:hypothetical protein
MFQGDVARSGLFLKPDFNAVVPPAEWRNRANGPNSGSRIPISRDPREAAFAADG